MVSKTKTTHACNRTIPVILLRKIVVVLLVSLLPVMYAADKDVLLSLYSATNGAGWTTKTKWNTSNGICTWYGITCNSNNRVTEIVLSNNSLVGTMPTELGELNKLEKLALNRNYLTGTIPSEIWQLTSLLTLFLGTNSLSGTIPALSQIPTMQNMMLKANKLTGTIPTELFTSTIEVIGVGENNLTGTIPTEIGNLSGSADKVFVNQNCLSGTIPTEVANIGPLSTFYVWGNNLTGTFPSSLCSADVFADCNDFTPACTTSCCNGDSGSCGVGITDRCYSSLPSSIPSKNPSSLPSISPSSLPSIFPSSLPSILPSSLPSNSPSSLPSILPSNNPSSLPSILPSNNPSILPSDNPSSLPSNLPSNNPSSLPTSLPSNIPSSSPSSIPTSLPSSKPSYIPSDFPSRSPSSISSLLPTLSPTQESSGLPSLLPTNSPSLNPTVNPSTTPTWMPSISPTLVVSGAPSFSMTPSFEPSNRPIVSHYPSIQPSSMPSQRTTEGPSSIPTMLPSFLPTSLPSTLPSSLSSLVPSTKPSEGPSFLPSLSPTMCEASMTPSDQRADFIVYMFKDNDELTDENVASIETLTVTFLQPIVAPDICNLTLTIKVLSSTSIDLNVSFLLLYTFQYICDVNTDGYTVLYQGLMNNLNEYETYIQTDLLLDQVTFNFEDNPVETDDVETMVLAVDLSMEITETQLSVLTALTIDFVSKYVSADVYDITLVILFEDIDSETTALTYQFSIICENGVNCASPLTQILSDNFDEYTTIILNDERLLELMNVASLSFLSEEGVTSVTMEANNAPDRQLSEEERNLLSTLTETFTQPLNSASMQITGIDVTSTMLSGQRNLQGNIVYITISIKARAISAVDIADEVTTFMEKNALEYISLIKGDGGLGSIDGTYFYPASINLLLSKPSSIPSQYAYVNATYVDTNEGTIDPSSLSGAIGGAAAAAAAAAASSSSSSDSDSDANEKVEVEVEIDDENDKKEKGKGEEKEEEEVEIEYEEDEDEDEEEGLEYDDEDDEDDREAVHEGSMHTNHLFRLQVCMVMACLKLSNRRVGNDDIAHNSRVYHSTNDVDATGKEQ